MEWGLLHAGAWPVLLLGTVPLLVHLISRRRARDVPFAAMEFVLRSQKRSARRIQLRQWLLMLARTLVMLLLLLAILGPFQVRQAVTGGNTGLPLRHVLAVDVSASMLAVVNGRTRLEASVSRARRMLADLPPEEPAAVVVCGTQPQATVEPPAFDRAVVDQALVAIQPSQDAADLPTCLTRARAALGSSDAPGRITLFSDAARHAWDARQKPDLRGLSVALVRPDDDNPVNHAVVGLAATPAPEAGRRTLAIAADVVEPAATDATGAELEVQLEVDGVAAARGMVTLAGPTQVTRRFTHALPATNAAPVHDLRVSLPADAYPLDDQLWLPVRTPREIRVLVVDGDPQTVAWRDEVFYLERALALPPRAGGTVVPRIITQAPTVADVEGADVVMLCNVRNLPRDSASALERLVTRGGGLFISGGDRLDVEFYNGALGALLPQPLRGEKSRVELDNPQARDQLGLGDVDGTHPVFAPFGGQRPEGLARAQTHTVLLLETGSRAERQVLMRFSNGAPALLERTVGAGHVVLLATSIDRDWSDLAIRPGFLPLMQQVVLYLADALEDARPHHVLVGQTRTLPVRRGVERVVLVSPGGVRTELATAEGQTEVVLPAATETGVHQVWMAPRGGDLAELPQERFAVWPPPSESDLVPLTDEEVTARLPDGVTLLGRGTPEGPPHKPLWPYLLVLLQLALLAEGLLARRG